MNVKYNDLQNANFVRPNISADREIQVVATMHQDASVWINGTQKWVAEHVACGWQPYYVNIMFDPLSGSPERVKEQMRRAIEDEMFGRLCCLFSRRPSKEPDRLPKLFLFPDFPVWKHEKASLSQFSGNVGGLHYNGPFLVPPVSRVKSCPIKLIKKQHHLLACEGISRIHLMEAPKADGMVDYAAKTLKWGRASADDVILLPRPLSELPSQRSPMMFEMHMIKALRAQSNYSDETIRELFRS